MIVWDDVEPPHTRYGQSVSRFYSPVVEVLCQFSKKNKIYRSSGTILTKSISIRRKRDFHSTDGRTGIQTCVRLFFCCIIVIVVVVGRKNNGRNIIITRILPDRKTHSTVGCSHASSWRQRVEERVWKILLFSRKICLISDEECFGRYSKADWWVGRFKRIVRKSKLNHYPLLSQVEILS